jgi:hypothetical protein
MNDTRLQKRLQRQRERRQRAIASGGSIFSCVLSPVAVASLEALVRTGMTKTEAVNRALIQLASMR